MLVCAALTLSGCSGDDTAAEGDAGTGPQDDAVMASRGDTDPAAEGPPGGYMADTFAAEDSDGGGPDGGDRSTRTRTFEELPADFPPGIPLPAEHTVNMATVSSGAASPSYVVQLRVPGEARAVFDEVTARFVEGGWEELQRSTSHFGESPTSSATYSDGTILVNLGAIAAAQDGDAVALTYAVVPAGSVLNNG